jgi:3-oxoadipate enol-lactonase
MGGATALGLAELHPDRVDRVVACDSPAMSTPASAQQWEERITAAQKGGMEALVESTMARWFPPEIHAAKPLYLDKVRAMIRATPVNGFIGCSAALAAHDYNTTVATVTRPVLFIAGSKDGVTPAAMKDMNARLKGSRYVELEGAGHISNLDQPVEFTRALREFLEA